MMKIIFGLILIHTMAHADLDKDQRQGMQETQELLTSPSKRQEFIKKDKRAGDIDAKVSALAGDDKSKEAIYGMAAKVFEKIALEAKGDPQTMQRLLLEAQSNPEAFMRKYMDEGQKAQVRKIAEDIEKRQGKTPAHAP